MIRSLIKRLFDILVSVVGLVLTSPIMLFLFIAIYIQDFHSPVYRGVRIGRGEIHYKLLKFRSMIIDAESVPIDTTAANDPRLTPLGRVIRRAKIDELLQFINVIRGDMSVVGPRPQLSREAALYTLVERKLFTVRPGITDISSIVFSDLESIVATEPDPDLAYNQLVRPWKSRLGLVYVENQSLPLDMAIILLTLSNAVWRRGTLRAIAAILEWLGAEPSVVAVARRTEKLVPAVPPGATAVVTSRIPAGRPATPGA